MKKRNALVFIFLGLLLGLCVTLPFLFPKPQRGIVTPKSMVLTESASDQIGDFQVNAMVVECFQSGIESYNYVTNTYIEDLSEKALYEKSIKLIDKMQALALYVQQNKSKNSGLKLALDIVKPLTRVTSILPNYIGSESDVREIKSIGQDLTECIGKYFVE